MKRGFSKWFSQQSDTTKAFILIIIILIIGIIIRWDYVIDNITKGFEYFSNK